MRSITVILVAGLVLIATSCGRVYPPEQPAPEAPPEQAEGPSGEQPSQEEEEPEGPFDPWDEVLEDTREIDGYFTFHLKRDNTLYLELAPARLGQDFGLVMHYSQGVGDFNIHDGLWLSGFNARLMRFRREGDKIYLVHRNPRFQADPGTPMAGALADNVGHSIVGAFDIESRNDSTGHLLIDVTDFFVSDYADVGRRIGFFYEGAPRLDDDRSYIDQVMGFPGNVEIDALLTYGSGDFPQVGGAGVSDYRSIPVGVRYSLFALPEDPMEPRPADDRVGYFLTAKFDFSRDQKPTPFVRYINRWRLEKEDPTAAVSEPVEPIVYWIDRSVPEEYREYVEQGIEAWNKAFRAAGFQNAIVAKQAPANDSTWSAEDMRYSTVRWTPGYNMGYAIGPSQVDPRTGELLNADILISALWPTFWLRDWDFLAAPEARLERYADMYELSRTLPPGMAGRRCMAAIGKMRQLALQHTLLVGMGVLDAGAPMPEEYIGIAIRDLVMHEVGHTLGLRHNFKASSAIPTDRLHDEAFTREHGVTLSVMDYGPVNVALDPDEQGYYWNPEVGSYDVWAIKYGYAPVYQQSPDAEFSYSGALARSYQAKERALDKIAELAADPMHAYGTDGDALFGPFGIDPRTMRYDLGSDPLAWARSRAALVDEIKPRLSERLIAEGDGWQRLRSALPSLIFERFSALLPVTKMVGGLFVSRSHKGDPNANPPFVPVSAERQRAAVELIIEQAFSRDAFQFDPELLNHLQPNRWSHWGAPGPGLQIDFPIHGLVASVQGALLSVLFSPARLSRMVDNQVRMPAGQPYRLGELFSTLTDAIWSELDDGSDIDSFRRNLQRMYTEHLMTLLLQEEAGFLSATVPEDARSLARLELNRISDQISAVLDGSAAGLDRATRAHLAESRARIERALEASLTISVEG